NSPYGPTIYNDATNFIAGINAYIKAAQTNPLMMPGEYDALGTPQGPQPFSLEDLVSIATLVGGIFGNGGGDQLNNAILYENLLGRFGREHFSVPGSPQLASGHPPRPGADRSALATFESFDAAADP